MLPSYDTAMLMPDSVVRVLRPVDSRGGRLVIVVVDDWCSLGRKKIRRCNFVKL